jgi:hypothetical protein
LTTTEVGQLLASVELEPRSRAKDPGSERAPSKRRPKK